jgi:hypothetical protein
VKENQIFVTEVSNVPMSFDLYLIPTRKGRVVLFATRRSLSAYGASEKDRFLRFVRRMMRSRNRVVRWVGRVSRMGHRYYQRLEDRIDPIERMVKALNYPGMLTIRHAPGLRAREAFEAFLRHQAVKHTVWVVADGLVTGVAIVLAPFMAPIPGPNVFFFYPFLRLMSHVQALRGARRALADPALSFREDARLALLHRDSDSWADPAMGEVVEGMDDFLRRVG